MLIAIVLGVMWMDNLPTIEPRYHFFDLFCGDAKASAVWKLGCPKVTPLKLLRELPQYDVAVN